MTSALVVAVLLSTQADGPDPLAKARQAMLGGARLPWLLHVTGSIARSGKEGSERFVLEWEPCGRREVRGYRSSAADRMFSAADAMVCGTHAIEDVRVEKNGTQIRYVWERSGPYSGKSFALDVDPRTGLISRSRSHNWMTWGRPSRRRSETVTAEFSDFKPVGTARLPRQIRLQLRDRTELWTVEQIDLVPLP